MDLEARVRTLEDIEQIKAVKGRYALGADPTIDADAIAELFTDDADFIVERFGEFHGRKAIRDFIAGSPFTWMFHCMIPQTIEVDPVGDSAVAKWYLWELANYPDPASGETIPVWIAGAYSDTMAKIGGKWLIARSELKLEMVSPYDKGWVKQRFIL